MQAITTKYLGPTDNYPSRVRAITACGTKITLPWQHSLDSDDNHKRAALALAQKLGWQGTYQGGHTKDGMIFAVIDDSTQIHPMALTP